MAIENSSTKQLRAAIIGQTKQFLIGLESGASDEQLLSILSTIKEAELLLIKEDRTMLDPAMWKLLQSHFTNRKNKDPIGTTG